MDLGAKGIQELITVQQEVLGGLASRIGGVAGVKTRPGLEE